MSDFQRYKYNCAVASIFCMCVEKLVIGFRIMFHFFILHQQKPSLMTIKSCYFTANTFVFLQLQESLVMGHRNIK